MKCKSCGAKSNVVLWRKESNAVKGIALQCSGVQRVMQYSLLQYSAVECSGVQRVMQYSVLQYSAVEYKE